MTRKRFPVHPPLGADKAYQRAVCDRLHALREDLGMTREEFAAAVGVTRTMIWRYEESYAAVPLTVASRAASLAGVKIGTLVGR